MREEEDSMEVSSPPDATTSFSSTTATNDNAAQTSATVAATMLMESSKEAMNEDEENNDATKNDDDGKPTITAHNNNNNNTENTREMLKRATTLKQLGNQHFATHSLEEALISYRECLSILSSSFTQQQQQEEQVVEEEAKTMEVAVRSNIALVLYKQERYEEVEMECTLALRLDSANAKVLYRRALAREQQSATSTSTSTTSSSTSTTTTTTLSNNQYNSLIKAQSDLHTCVTLLSKTLSSSSSTLSSSGNKKKKKQNAAAAATAKKSLREAQYALERVTKILDLHRKQLSQQQQQQSEKESVVLMETTEEEDVMESCNTDNDGGGGEIRDVSQCTATAAPQTEQQNQSMSNVTNQNTNGDKAIADIASPPQQQQKAPTPYEQKQIILQLLSSTQQQQQPTSQKQQSRKPIKGEAYFLLNTKWWNTFCHYIDICTILPIQRQLAAKLEEEEENVQEVVALKVEIMKKRKELIKLLPPGTTLPKVVFKESKTKKKKKKDTMKKSSSSSSISSSSSSSYSSDSSSSSESEDYGNDIKGYGLSPGTIDNSSLLLRIIPQGGGIKEEDVDLYTPHDVFYNEWRLALHTKHQNNSTTTSSSPVENLANTNGNTCNNNNNGRTHEIRPNLIRGHDYELIPREVYAALRCWYGENTPSICRRVEQLTRQDDDDNDENEEGGMYHLVLYPEFYYSSSPNNSIVHHESNTNNNVCGACRRNGAKRRCTRCLSIKYCGRDCQASHWHYHRSYCCSSSSSSKKKSKMESNGVILGWNDLKWGRVGLNNLGNTCFMNSALQCLSHAAPLTRHFLTNRFRQELNPSNPLGTSGKLAIAYDSVLKELWMGGHKNASISPTALKRAVAVFAPRFAGVSQHDAMEFLAYLLDGLHEDLNRVINAPYVEMPDVATGQRLSISGAEAWDAYCRRNDSLVMDTFYGQFKSTCVCPRCNRECVSFETFNHVSLEIPQTQSTTRTISVLLFRNVPVGSTNARNVPIRYGVHVPKNGSIGDIKHVLSGLCGIKPARLAVCDVYENSIYEILQDGKAISSIRADDFIAAYEVDPYTGASIHAIATHTRGDKGFDLLKINDDSDERNLFGYPFLTSFDARLTCAKTWNHVWRQVSRLLLRPAGLDNNSKAAESLKSTLRIRIVDNSGKPRPVFGKREIDSAAMLDAASLLPRDSNANIADFLGGDCTERFLFISLEWSDGAMDGLKLIDESRFLSYADHSSLLVTLDQCFETFTRPERLDEHNTWYCSRCKEHVRAMKTMELWKLPNVLVVHLKRFEFKHALRREKLDTFVDFPLQELDMSRHCASSSSYSRCHLTTMSNGVSPGQNGPGSASEESFVIDDIPAIYDLFAVTNHYGRMGFGHYTAYARKWGEEGMSDQWAAFDDSSVCNLKPSMVVTPAAYILFYRRRIFD